MKKGIYGLVVENKKVLVVEKDGKYILPGGKPIHPSESDLDVLKREFRKELSGTEIFVDLYYRTFKGIPPNDKINILTKNYFCYPLENIGEPSNEISSKKWVNGENLRKEKFSKITEKVLYSLIEDNLID